MDEQADFVTVEQLADMSGLTRGRIRQILLEGRDLHGSKVGATWIVPAREAARWLAAREQRERDG